ncbi:hypothetical protein NE237_033060 [Protea cynaroides]|uniref:B box-type domain-containing protein n=1 Tax=Protea cynaroides TaxID=273540 RepID=A0A9Q0L461_9MAGN|nr:hypothetical protein NE237_033060 [Protea cynaroides]
MKIQCDVCNKEEASLFCLADEAALCHGCNHRVHHTNELAGKHHCFPLLHSSSKESPHCDICQEIRAFLFCREDIAILCVDCDFSIHTANEHTTLCLSFLYNHNYQCLLIESCNTAVPTEINPSQVPLKKKPNFLLMPPLLMTPKIVDDVSISEYMIEKLSGWQVDEFLDSSAPFSFCQVCIAPLLLLLCFSLFPLFYLLTGFPTMWRIISAVFSVFLFD